MESNLISQQQHYRHHSISTSISSNHQNHHQMHHLDSAAQQQQLNCQSKSASLSTAQTQPPHHLGTSSSSSTSSLLLSSSNAQSSGCSPSLTLLAPSCTSSASSVHHRSASLNAPLHSTAAKMVLDSVCSSSAVAAATTTFPFANGSSSHSNILVNAQMMMETPPTTTTIAATKFLPPNITNTAAPPVSFNGGGSILNASTQHQAQFKWTLFEPHRIALAIYNFLPSSSSLKSNTIKSRLSTSTAVAPNSAQHCLEFYLGDVLVIVERNGQWYRGYVEGKSSPPKLGIFPITYVQLFDRSLQFPDLSDCDSNSTISQQNPLLYYTLLDPLFLQVVRTLREWHAHLLELYRGNVSAEKYATVRKLMYELLDICGTLGRELAPTLWRRRCNQILKANASASRDVRSYLDEDDISDLSTGNGNSSGSRSLLEPSLEELYDRTLSKLNLGNQLLGLEIMPSFMHGTFSSDATPPLTYSQLIRRNLHLSRQYWNCTSGPGVRGKFRPYYAKENSKYLTAILDYYNRVNRKFCRKLAKSSTTNSSSQPVRTSSLSFHSPLHSSHPGQLHSHVNSANSLNSSAAASSSSKKCRRHLLFSIREANFAPLFANLPEPDQSPLLQIDIHLLRCSYTSGDSGIYQVLTEKYCYRTRASQQQPQQQQSTKSWTNISRALFLDVLSKKSQSNNSLALNGGSSSNGSASFTSQHSDSANYFLVIQVWRYGRMLLSESRTKNMLSATMSSATASLSSAGTSVFHTSASSLGGAGTSSTSLSSLGLFGVGTSTSNASTFFGDKSSDSSSIDSSELLLASGAGSHCKRGVGYAVVPLLELVSKDQEIKPDADLLKDECLVSRLLLSDEQMLLPVPIKLFEGDLTAATLETILKHRQQQSSSNAISSNTLPFSTTSASNASAAYSKLSHLSPSTGYQLTVCAKFISERLPSSHQHHQNNLNNSMTVLKSSALSPKLGLGSLTDPMIQNSPSSGPKSQSTNSASSLADWLLLSQGSTNVGTLTNRQSSISSDSNHSQLKAPSFVVVQKRFFGDLITAGYFRNDFYLTLDSAEFEKGGKAIPKNIEVAVCLFTENGIQERALSSGANDEPVTVYRSHIQYHQNTPKWFEQLKINVPLELFESAHLRFTFYHCSSKDRERKFLGFSFLPLSDQNGACLGDGEHELYIYKCDTERKLDDVAYYLNVPWGHSPSEKPTSNSSSAPSSIASSSAASSSSSLAATSTLINSRLPKEVFHIRTNLVSSKLTQNSDILSLLKWSCTPLEQVYDALQRLSRVPGEELVKFLEDILDALFTLFTTSSGSLESSGSQMTIIFRVLVDFFKTLNDPKFVSYRAALETYIETQFSAPLVHPSLMACVKKYIELVIISFQTDATTGSPPSLSGVTKRELEFILRCLSVFDWILKIIVQSRILYAQASCANGTEKSPESTAQSCEDFRGEIFSLFSSINRLLAVESKSSDDYLIIAIQESVLSTLPNAFSYLSKILSPLELAKLVKSIVNANNSNKSASQQQSSDIWSPVSSVSSGTTPTNSNQSGSVGSKKTIIGAKLSLLQETIRCQYVWSNDEARLELLDTFIRLLNVNIGESKNCLSILHDIVLYLIENGQFSCGVALSESEQRVQRRHSCVREVEMLSFGAIDAIVEHIIELTGVVSAGGGGSSFDLVPFSYKNRGNQSSQQSAGEEEDYLGNYILCFMVLLEFMTTKNYERIFETRSPRQCKELISAIFMVFLNALYYFSDSWLEVKMAVNRIILQSLAALRRIMSQEFLGASKFDITIWRTYFKLSIAFLTQQRLQLECQPYWKRRFILDTYGGDMRLMMGRELVECWSLIGASRIAFIPSLVAPFIDVTLVPELELRRATLPIFYDMLAVDYETNGNFKQVESALIDKLDTLAHKHECDVQYRELFTRIMTNQIEHYKPIWYLDGHQLVKSAHRLLSLLIDYRHELKCKLTTPSITKQPNSAANEVDDSLLICTYTLLRFFRDEIDSYNRRSLMLRYVDKLASLHTQLGNFSEAAFTLKLHADQLSWSPADAAKKEQLCETMLNYFERGQCWEEGIRVCQDLQDIYQHNYKYGKLSVILKRHAELLDKILSEHRSEADYFRVSFYGLDFPSFLQNSTFIFRGHEFEKISNFTHRIQQEFPNAQLLTKNVPTDESITDSQCQYIQVYAVKPVGEPPVSPDQTLIFGLPDPDALTYYVSNSVRQFQQDRPVQKAPFDPNNEFKSLWVERTTYTTEKPLPGILRMFQVVQIQVSYLSPIENAAETIENMNIELLKLISLYNVERPAEASISLLSMRLQGILDAAVNGGIAKYIDAFLGSEFLTANPDQASKVTLLKNRIAHQIKIVESGLTLHGKLAPTNVRPLHTRLLERFATMRATVNQANIETSQALLWTPNSHSHQHHSTSTPNRPSILSQPLPPIPGLIHHQHRQSHHDGSSDPETSSLSSSSSMTMTMQHCSNPTYMHNNEQNKMASTPPLLPPPPPPAFSSPNGKKNKPLPPLPPPTDDQQQHPPLNILNGKSIPPTTVQRHNSISNFDTSSSAQVAQSAASNLFRSRSKQNLNNGTNVHLLDECIYSVPQLPSDILMDQQNQGSSVDEQFQQQQSDNLDYYDESSSQHSSSNVSNGYHGSKIHVQLSRTSNIYRSRSIPRSSLSHYHGSNGSSHGSQAGDAPLLPPLQRGQSNQNLNELVEDEVDCSISGGAPPPLPPRSNTNLDRSNSLNSGMRSSPVIPPLIPPALPQRRAQIKSSSSTLTNSSYPSSVSTVISNTFSSKDSHTSESTSISSTSYLTHLDGIEFENLVISSPTPRSESSHPPSRPAPIIGIEINDREDDIFSATPLIAEAMSSNGLNGSTSNSKLQEHRSKSSSLPRAQQFPPNFDSKTVATKVEHRIETITSSSSFTSSIITSSSLTTNGTNTNSTTPNRHSFTSSDN